MQTVKIKWTGKEDTLVRLEDGGKKVEVEPGDVFDMPVDRAKRISDSYPQWKITSELESDLMSKKEEPIVEKIKKEDCEDCKDLPEGLVIDGHNHQVVLTSAEKKKAEKDAKEAEKAQKKADKEAEKEAARAQKKADKEAEKGEVVEEEKEEVVEEDEVVEEESDKPNEDEGNKDKEKSPEDGEGADEGKVEETEETK